MVDKFLNCVSDNEYRLAGLIEVADSDNVHEDGYERLAGQGGHVTFKGCHHIDFSRASFGNLYMLVATTDGWSVRHEEDSNQGCVRVQNACGFIRDAQLRDDISVIWRAGRSVFGVLQVAYSTGGNISVRGNQLMFKVRTVLTTGFRVLTLGQGATNASNLNAIVARMCVSEPAPMLQLMVLSVGLGRCLHVHVGCLLEVRLARFPWIDVMNRIEEVLIVILFATTDICLAKNECF